MNIPRLFWSVAMRVVWTFAFALPVFLQNFSLLAMTSFPATPAPSSAQAIFAPVRAYIESVQKEFDQIPSERKAQLKQIALFTQTKLAAKEPANLMFICTHNSRRSHTAQIWAQTLAAYYGLENVRTFSAGTETTAFNERAVKALQRAGFTIAKSKDPVNPIYSVYFAEGADPIRAYSKLISDEANPKKNFCAVMNCSEAEQACPMVLGAEMRISTPYDDPKNFDGKPEETAKYDERCRQIAREMAYAFSQVQPDRPVRSGATR